MDTVTDRPIFTKLSPDGEQEFLLKQAEFEAAYRNDEPLALFHALVHAWWFRQTVPGWLVPAIGDFIVRNRTGDEAERYRERMRHLKRYVCIRDLRQKYNKDHAVDLAVEMLQGTSAGGVTRRTIEDSYDIVRKDLKRRGRESEFFFLVDDADPSKGA